jgi:hypothetical protein
MVTMLFYVLRKKITLRKVADVLMIHHHTLFLDPNDGTLASIPPQNLRSCNAVIADCKKLKLRI